MKIIAKRLAVFIFLLSIWSCKNDANPGNELIQHKESPEEAEWLKDYKRPSIRWGFIDENGKDIIPQMYDDVRDFSTDGIALANFNGRWGFIDKSNKVVIPFKYLDAHPFSEQLSLVQNFDKSWHYINLKGEKVFDCPGEEASSFKNGMAVFKIKGLKGLIDMKGTIVIQPKYDELMVLNPDLLIAQYGDDYGLLNGKGDWVIKPQFQKMYADEANYIRVKKGEELAYLDKRNKKVVSPFYEYASPFINGLAAVKKDEDYHIINESYQSVYTGKNKIKPGGENKWIEEENGKFRFLHTDGSVLTANWYDALYEYEEGLAGFQKGEFWGYVNDKGEEVIPAELPIIWSCKEGKIRIVSQGGYGFITKDYTLKVAPKYLEARDFTNGLARVAN